MRTQRIYYSQYGYVWSYSLAEAMALAENAIVDGEHTLADDHQIKRRYCGHSGQGRNCRCRSRDHHHCPLNWGRQDWKYHLEELKELDSFYSRSKA